MLATKLTQLAAFVVTAICCNLATAQGVNAKANTAYIIESALGRGEVLSVLSRPGSEVAIGSSRDPRGTKFRLLPAGGEYFYIALAANPNLVIEVTNGAAANGAQLRLWDSNRVNPAAAQFRLRPAANGFNFVESRLRRELVFDVGQINTAGAANVRMFGRSGWKSGQWFRLIEVSAPPAAAQFISQSIVASPPLPPAPVELLNTHSKELWVLLADLRDPTRSQRLKIPRGRSVMLQLDRDPGAALVEIYEVVSPLGIVSRQELVTQFPPSVLYDISVYELFTQSLAIDATVPGGKLMDVNYSPKSVGWFVVPPGAALTGGRTDVYNVARQWKNPGQVRRLDPKLWGLEQDPVNPLDGILRRDFGIEPR